LQGLFNHSMGHILARDSRIFARGLHDRGKRIWAAQGVVSLPLELGDTTQAEGARVDNRPAIRRTDETARQVINDLASLFDVAYNPRLLATELVAVLSSVKAVAPTIVETSTQGSESRTQSVITFPIGEVSSGRTIFVTCGTPSNAYDAVALADIH